LTEGSEPDAVHGAGSAAPVASGGPHSGAVFISYASADVAVADALVATLEDHEVACWIAPRDVKAGALYAEAIVRAISDAKALVLVLSANSVASAHVGKEVERASSKRRPVIALRIDDAPLSPALEYFLGESHWVDARAGGMERAVTKLIAAIRQPERVALGISPTSNPGASADSAAGAYPKSGARILIAAGLAVLAVALAVLLGAKLGVLKPGTRENLTGAVASTALVRTPGAPGIPEESVAVLPFVDMSEKHDQEYFSDGLSEELIDMLAKIPDLRVPARTSSFYFKGKQATIPEIAKALSVSHVLEGSVRKSGSALRITAQLIRADNGYHLWSETYDRKVDDIFKTQDDIAGAVVEALRVSLSAGHLATKQTTTSEVYLLYMKGRYLNGLGSLAEEREAVESLRRAVSLDSSYAPAWLELATAYVNLSGYFDLEPSQHMPLGREAARKAITLNPDDAAAHYLLATILVSFDHDWYGALSEIDAANRADPNLTEPAEIVWVQGCNAGPCHEKFIQDISRDIERDPLNVNALGDRAYAHYYAGELPAAEADARHVIAISPGHVEGSYALARILMARRKLDEATRILDAMPDSLYKRQGLALAYFYQGQKARADAALADLLAKDSEDGCFQIAELYGVRGDSQAAIDWLERDYDRRMYGILDIKVDPLFRSFTHDPRYIALVHKFAPPNEP
jgi:adenylate cyclase